MTRACGARRALLLPFEGRSLCSRMVKIYTKGEKRRCSSPACGSGRLHRRRCLDFWSLLQGDFQHLPKLVAQTRFARTPVLLGLFFSTLNRPAGWNKPRNSRAQVREGAEPLRNQNQLWVWALLCAWRPSQSKKRRPGKLRLIQA